MEEVKIRMFAEAFWWCWRREIGRPKKTLFFWICFKSNTQTLWINSFSRNRKILLIRTVLLLTECNLILCLPLWQLLGTAYLFNGNRTNLYDSNFLNEEDFRSDLGGKRRNVKIINPKPRSEPRTKVSGRRNYDVSVISAYQPTEPKAKARPTVVFPIKLRQYHLIINCLRKKYKTKTKFQSSRSNAEGGVIIGRTEGGTGEKSAVNCQK